MLYDANGMTHNIFKKITYYKYAKFNRKRKKIITLSATTNAFNHFLL